MSIFGNLDINDQLEINDDPFYVEPSTYWAICTDFVEKTMNDGSDKAVITWTIDEPDNEFHGTSKQEYYGLFKNRLSWNDYTADEKKVTKFFRKRLREAFDLSQADLASVSYSECIGKGAYITLTASKGKEGTANAGKTFVNVTNALCKRLYEEQNDTNNSVSSSLGL